MTTNNIKIQYKICKHCSKTKEIDEFYKNKNTIMPRCKTCYKLMDRKYINRYVKKGTGFVRLPQEIQEDIIYLLFLKVPKKYIAEKHKEHIKYQAFLKMIKRGEVAEYTGEIKEDYEPNISQYKKNNKKK